MVVVLWILVASLDSSTWLWHVLIGKTVRGVLSVRAGRNTQVLDLQGE